MKEVIRISKDEDKAIIMSLKSQPDVKLSSAQIKEYISKFIKITRSAAYKKIERMREFEYLLHEKDKSSNYIHWLNPEIDFILEGPPLKFLKNPIEGATSAQVEHTSYLKEAIRTWIDNLAEPNPNFLGTANGSDYSSVIDACENHVLFRDLSNHLPVMGIKICEQWKEYKFHNFELLGLKINLLSYLKNGISESFEGLKFDFTYNGKEYPSNYAYRLLSSDLYDMVISLESGNGVDHYKESISKFENEFPVVVKNGDYIQWGGDRIFLRVPSKDKVLLEACLKKFLVFLKNIPDSEFMVMAKDIIAKVDQLKSEREHILRKLKEAMLYAYFPGKCQYLQPD
ncbi:MAG: hypothetical protein WAW52_01175 [Methanothrix sp.]